MFTHYREDRHQDHRVLSDLTWNTFRNHFILEYEIPKYDGDLGSPNLFVPLDESVCRRKVENLCRVFQSQKKKHWFSEDTFLALMRLRGSGVCLTVCGSVLLPQNDLRLAFRVRHFQMKSRALKPEQELAARDPRLAALIAQVGPFTVKPGRTRQAVRCAGGINCLSTTERQSRGYYFLDESERSIQGGNGFHRSWSSRLRTKHFGVPAFPAARQRRSRILLPRRSMAPCRPERRSTA